MAEAEQTPYGDPLGFAEGEWSDAADPAEEFGEAPEPEAPNESPNELGHLLGDLLDLAARAMTRIKDVPPETWQEIVEDPLSAALQCADAIGVKWERSLEHTLAFARARLAGDYAVDEFGFDPEFTEVVLLPILRLLAEKWFRVELRGADRLPAGGALLVANHAGTLPLDALVLHTVIHDATGRHTRMLGADNIFDTPYVADFAARIGTAVASPANAARLLDNGELVTVFPEGFKGLGKPYAERYRLQRFGRGGFVSTAVSAGVPIVPVAVVGSEEIYPMLGDIAPLARLLGLPYVPVTPTFPWLGLLGAVPLPSKWIISIGEPIDTSAFAEPAEPGAPVEADPVAVMRITEQIRGRIQARLHELLAERPNAFPHLSDLG